MGGIFSVALPEVNLAGGYPALCPVESDFPPLKAVTQPSSSKFKYFIKKIQVLFILIIPTFVSEKKGFFPN